MRWENISSPSDNELYQLWNNDSKLLTLTVHPFSNTARVETEDEKRVFLIRKEGFRRNKTVLRNEYGIKLGEFGTDEQGNFINMDEERFYYTADNGLNAKVNLYHNPGEQPFASCDVHIEANRYVASQSSLLLALCWYMTHNAVSKETLAEFAA